MQRAQVESSQIAAIGYDPEAQVLEVEFKTGKVYQYFEVPAVEYSALVMAESVGRQFNKAIKGSYRYQFVEDEEEETAE